MVYIYPTVIRGTHYRSAQYHTQEMTNRNALCSPDKNLAGWGVQRPIWYPNYLRAWPDSLTSRSGSYYTPDTIHATGFSLDGNGKAKITALSVEYKWEQISYSCGTSDCFGKFNNPVINLKHNNKVIGSTFGNKPEPNRYYNNKADPNKMNTDNAELATLHSHSFNIASYGLTVNDLKNLEVEFIPADNTSYNHLRIVMQFLRLSIKKEDYIPKPLCRIYGELTKDSALINEEFTYKLKLDNINKEFSTTTCDIQIPNGLSIVDYECSTGSNLLISDKEYTWEVTEVNSNHNATLSINLIGTKQGEKEIITKILENADSLYHTTSNKINILKSSIAFNLDVNDNIFHAEYQSPIIATMLLTRSEKSVGSEFIIFESDGLFTENKHWDKLPEKTEYLGDGKWKFYDIQTTKLELKAQCIANNVGDYVIKATHKEEGKDSIIKEEQISILGSPLTKNYFKLRLEDGSDVRYNSLMFTEGDDLTYPLTYEIKDTESILDYVQVIGEKRRIPTKEAKYINFKILLNTDEDITYKNILTTISVDSGVNNNIVVGADEDIEIFNGVNNKYFVIDELKSNEEKNIRFIVQSDIEQTCKFELKILNETRDDWIPSTIIFKDMPSIKLNIENITSSNDFFITEQNEGKFTLRYSIQNLSNINGKNIKFKIDEPYDFKKGRVITPSTYDENTKIWDFETLNDNKKHFIDIEYTAKKKNIYDFILKTYDDEEDEEDDQYINQFIYRMYINIDSNVIITTSASKSHPFVNEIFDYKINVKNLIKKQEKFTFQISDIGQYNLLHSQNDYIIENINCENGTFTPNNDENNIIGKWVLENIDIDSEYELVLSLRPISTGTHIIHTIFTDTKQNTEDFNSYIKVYNEQKKIEFNVHQAIGEKKECQPCNELIEICDEDFVNIGDKFYYIFNIKNNDKNALSKINIYANIHKSLTVDCEPNNVEFYKINQNPESKLDKYSYKFVINSIPKCGQITFCIRLTPTKNGEFLSDFVLTTKDAHILNKTLKMTVSNIFMERKLRHQIDIYNFEKTNRYFRYELDGSGNLFKFYNKGDLTYRFIRPENYDVNRVESYIGENLQDLYRQIKKDSIYVDPQFVRNGTNKLLDNGYELYPDGFIRRFGLLKSEVYHFTGQLPRINNLVRYAMRWDIDDWNEKVWAGDMYSNGVFDLTIDYDKIPSNFDIMQDTMNPVLNLQNIVDKNKPYGTKGICYYSYSHYLDLYVNTKIQNINIDTQYNYEFELNRLGLISWYDRHDNSIFAHYDLFDVKDDINIIDINAEVTNKDDESINNVMNVDIYGCVDAYEPHINKILTNECLKLIQNKYYGNIDNLRHNIDITKKRYVNQDTLVTTDDNNIFINYNIINFIPNNSTEELLFTINDLHIIRINDKINNRNGFGVKEYKEMNILFEDDIETYVIQIESYGDVHHLWVSINEKPFYHFGYIYGKVETFNFNGDAYVRTEEPAIITIKIKDTINIINQRFDLIHSITKLNKWDNINRINDNKNSYAIFENNIKIDKECEETHVDAPPLVLKYNNFDIDEYDEITDIKVQIKAQSNKDNFMDDVNIKFAKNADYYLPNNDISTHIAYPTEIKNINKRYYPTVTIEEPNITICSKCLKTSLGYYDECPHCHSKYVVHYDKKQKATYCHNCEWITDGWVDRCEWCLSNKTEKIMIDYNRTVCNECGNIANDYYLLCPKCFSKDITHVQNDTHTINIYDNEQQNINPIVVQTTEIKNNICNIEVALNKDQVVAENLEYLNLHIHGHNYDDGKYFYCPSCDNSGEGNYEKCPYCESKSIENKINDKIVFSIYYKVNNYIKKISFNEGDTIEYGEFNKTLNLKKLALQNTKSDFFTLIIYVENLLYDSQIKKIIITSIDDEFEEEYEEKNIDLTGWEEEEEEETIEEEEEEEETIITDLINKINISIDNISSSSKYNNEIEWKGDTETIYGYNHKAITHRNRKDSTEYIQASNFEFKQHYDLDKAYLYIAGINESKRHAIIKVNIIDGDKLSSFTQYVENGVFSIKENIFDYMNISSIKNIKIQIGFKTVDNSNISILDTHIITKKRRREKIFDEISDFTPINIEQEKNTYLISCINNNLWELNNTNPKYLSKKVLESGLLCYIDFGVLNNDEYIRVYDINLVISYKNKMGNIIIKNITFEDEKNINNITGKLFTNNSKFFGSVKQKDIMINNLEYNDITNTGNENTFNAIPLNNTIKQSFICLENNIIGFYVIYFGKRGYPSDSILAQLYDDKNNKPHNLINEVWIDISEYSRNGKIYIPLDKTYTENGNRYWLVLKDDKADEYNYHRFRYSTINNITYEKELSSEDKEMLRTRKSLEKLILSKGKDEEEINYSLSFAVLNGYDVTVYNKLPVNWDSIINEKQDLSETEKYDSYNTLFRLNINHNSNTLLSELLMKKGYRIYY